MFDIWLVRHGQTFLNVFNRFQGWIDSELTDLGHEEAQTLGNKIRDENFQIVVSSDLHRAIQTRNDIVSELKERPQIVTSMPNFREVFFGMFEGLPAKKTWSYICKGTPFTGQDDLIKNGGFEKVRRLMKDKDSSHVAELNSSVLSRWNNGVDEIKKIVQNRKLDAKFNKVNVLIISHGTFIRTVASYYGQNVINNFPVNGGATIIRVYDEDEKLIVYNKKF